MWSTARSEAALEAALPVADRNPPAAQRAAAAPALRRSQRNAQADLPMADQPQGGARLGARPARLDRSAACARRARRAVRSRARSIPLEGEEVRLVWDPAAPRTPVLARRRAARAAAREPAFARRIELFLKRRALEMMSRRSRRLCRGRGRHVARRSASAMPERAGEVARRNGRIRLSWRLILAPPDGAPLRRRARGRASRPSRPQRQLQGARGAALRPGSRRGEGAATASRAAAASGSGGGVDSGCGCGAAAGGCGCALLLWRALLLRRERLVEFLLASARRCRRAGPSAAAADSPVRLRRGAERHAVLVDHRLHAVGVDRLVAVHLLLRESAASRASAPGSRTARPAGWRRRRS